MASTGALFAVFLAILAASDARLAQRGVTATVPLSWKPMLLGALVLYACAAAGNFLVTNDFAYAVRTAAPFLLLTLLMKFFFLLMGGIDAVVERKGWRVATRLPWSPVASQIAAVTTMGCLALASYITQQAAASESLIVRATKLALSVSQSGDYNNPKWAPQREEMLRLIREGIDINPHYRKITPMVADELAKWGDWKNAVWIWESVLGSRPYVAAIMTNVARGYAQMGEPDKAMAMLERAKTIQPNAPSVRSLEVILLSRNGNEAKALAMAREDIGAGKYDYDMVNTGFVLAMRAKDWDLAIKAMELRNKGWPGTLADGQAKIGNAWVGKGDINKALEHFRAALEATPPEQRQTVLNGIPQGLWPQLQK